MSKFDDIKMPDNIDEVTKNAIRRGKTKKHRHRRMNKVASILAIGWVGIFVGFPVIVKALPNIEENIDLYDAIDRLDEKYKTPVILQYFHDLTISQIAEIMECNENTVKSNIRRAKKKLYDILKEEK